MTGISVARSESSLVLLTGSPLAWGRDLAVLGAVSGVSASAGVGIMDGGFLSAASLAGLLCGFFLGLEMPYFLESARRRLSLSAIAVRCIAVGGATGAFMGLLSAHSVGEVFVGPFAVAGIAGALQFGWFWLPYTVLTVLGRRTWPVVVAACVMSPLLGALALALARGLVWLAF